MVNIPVPLLPPKHYYWIHEYPIQHSLTPPARSYCCCWIHSYPMNIHDLPRWLKQHHPRGSPIQEAFFHHLLQDFHRPDVLIQLAQGVGKATSCVQTWAGRLAVQASRWCHRSHPCKDAPLTRPAYLAFDKMKWTMISGHFERENGQESNKNYWNCCPRHYSWDPEGPATVQRSNPVPRMLNTPRNNSFIQRICSHISVRLGRILIFAAGWD